MDVVGVRSNDIPFRYDKLPVGVEKRQHYVRSDTRWETFNHGTPLHRWFGIAAGARLSALTYRDLETRR